MMIAVIGSSGLVRDVTGMRGEPEASEGASARHVSMDAGAIAVDGGSVFIQSSSTLWEIQSNGSLHQVAANVGYAYAMVVAKTGSILATYGQEIYAFSKSGQQSLCAGVLRYGNSGDGGPAASALLRSIRGLAADKAGNLYISDSESNVIRRVTPDGLISTFAGTGGSSYSGDGGPARQAQIAVPRSLAFDPSGNLYVAQNFGTFVRKIAPDGTITHFAGTGIHSPFCKSGCFTNGKAVNSSVSASAIVSDSKGQIYGCAT